MGRTAVKARRQAKATAQPVAPEPRFLTLAEIRLDGGTQPRVDINEDVVADYAATVHELPPVVVFFDGAAYWLADGFHRFHAHRRAGELTIEALVHQGTKRDAVLYAVGANTTHGLRRTNADKRRAVETLLGDETWRQWTNTEIARRCGVHHDLVSSVRSSLADSASDTRRTYITKHGTVATMDTSRIGKAAVRVAAGREPHGPWVDPCDYDEDDEERRQAAPADPVPAPPDERCAICQVASASIMEGGYWFCDDHGVDDFGGPDDIHVVHPEPELTAHAADDVEALDGEEPSQDVLDEEERAAASPRLAVHFSSESPEHYTPTKVIDRVLDVFGEIDLDPCSNAKDDDAHVPAVQHYTREDDGLSREWRGRVYMNPPYGREIDAWVEKLLAEHMAGRVTEAIALLPGRIDTQWFDRLRGFLWCVIKGRLTFVGNDDPAPFPSVVVYLGERQAEFYDAFADIGVMHQFIPREWIAS